MNTFTVGGTGDLLIGAGVAKLDNVNLALLFIGVGVALKILVAVLNRFNVPISSNLG